MPNNGEQGQGPRVKGVLGPVLYLSVSLHVNNIAHFEGRALQKACGTQADPKNTKMDLDCHGEVIRGKNPQKSKQSDPTRE